MTTQRQTGYIYMVLLDQLIDVLSFVVGDGILVFVIFGHLFQKEQLFN